MYDKSLIHWPGVKGAVRDIAGAGLATLTCRERGIENSEEIYNICMNDLESLKRVLRQMREDTL